MSAIANSLFSKANSTSYVDVVGLLLGETRLPGETAPAFLKRLERIASAQADHSYPGALEQISSELGFAAAPYISLNSTVANSLVTSNLSGLTFSNATESLTIPLVTMDPDSMWIWAMLSDIVSAINKSQTFTAQLLVQDGPALQLANQKNVFLATGESIPSQHYTLANSFYVPESAVLSDRGNPMTVTGQSLSLFKAPAAGTTVSYLYSVFPYTLVGSPVALLGLLDPGVSQAAVQPDGTIAYQVREYLNAVMQQDRSYWSQ